MKTPDWHPWQSASQQRPPRRWPEVVVPLVIVAVLLYFGARVMAGLVLGIAAALWMLRFWRPEARRRIDGWLGRFAEWLGKAAGVLLLAPLFFGILCPVRLWNRLNGRDPLGLKQGGRVSFWQAADTENRRTRHAARMFATEVRQGGRAGWLPLLLLGLLGLLATEGALRLGGVGRPLLFVQDPDIGYYPMPGQQVRYPGREIRINGLGMRSDETTPQAPEGVTRILMIGDSTLAGTRVSNHELYSELLEDRLNDLAGRKAFEVLNLGVNAWGPLHEEAFIRKFGTFDADVAVICGPVANVFRPRYGLERLPFSPHQNPPKTALGHAAYELLWRLRERTLGAPAWAIEGAVQDRQARIGTEAYAALAECFQKAGAEVLMEMLPARSTTLGMGPDPFSERHFAPIRERLGTMGVIINLCGPIFAGIDRPQEIYYDGVHFDRRGHRLYAEYLAGRLCAASSRVKAVTGR